MGITRRGLCCVAVLSLLSAGCVSEGLSVSFGDLGGGTSTTGDTSGGSTVGGTTLTTGGTTTGGSTAGSSSVAAQVIALVNDERSRAGVGPLTANSLLTAAASAHAEDMANNGFFSHTGSDGSSSADRATRAGYNWSTVGENIASGATTAAQVMEMWMNSSGHRANILNANFTEIGVAVDSRGGLLWVQVFGRPQ